MFANHVRKSGPESNNSMMPASDAEAIERFLRNSTEPALLEPGEPPFPLQEGTYALEERGASITIQVWDERRNLVRRITGVRGEKAGLLELAVTRFGGQEGRITLIDRARARPDTERRGARTVFRELFRKFLSRQYTGWKIAELSTEPNLEESLSPAYTRALLKRGTDAWAAIGAPREPASAGGALTFGLIWLDYLRRRERRLTVQGLAIFLPEDEARATCLRLAQLNPNAARYDVFVYSDHGFEQRIDPRDFGNLDTKLEPCSTGVLELEPPVRALVERLCEAPYVERQLRPDGGVSLRVRGLEFARASQAELRFGLQHRARATERNVTEAVDLARELARLRSARAADRDNPLFRLRPEGWLESEVRRRLQEIDATLAPAPVYGQVPAMAGGERGVLDLLAADHTGRLAVIEIKASEDVHLPLQALDYWIRVKWHAERGDFSPRGYFPGIALRRDSPRLLLVAPALAFHPKTETVLRYFAPSIEVERIGVGVEWRQGPKVVFRLRRAERPA